MISYCWDTNNVSTHVGRLHHKNTDDTIGQFKRLITVKHHVVFESIYNFIQVNNLFGLFKKIATYKVRWTYYGAQILIHK